MDIAVKWAALDVTSLGPGKRFALWFAGCNKKCKGCLSPEFRSRSDADLRPISLIENFIRSKRDKIDGITISGGEPLLQYAAVQKICEAARSAGITDILLYTGLTEAELSDSRYNFIKGAVGVVVSEAYFEQLNDPADPWGTLRGSTNQKITFYDEKLRQAYMDFCRRGRQINITTRNGGLLLVGIPPKPEV